MKKRKIEYDKILKKWIVWEQIGASAYKQVHVELRKKDCLKWLEKRNYARD